METIQRFITTDLGEKVLVVAGTHSAWDEDGKHKKVASYTDKVLKLDIVLNSDCDYHIEESDKYKFGLIDERGTGDYSGTIIFMTGEQYEMEQLASLFLIRLAGAVRNGLGQEWRVHNTAICLAHAALAINECAVVREYVPNDSCIQSLRKPNHVMTDYICDGNQDGHIYLEYIDNNIVDKVNKAIEEPEPEKASEGPHVEYCPYTPIVIKKTGDKIVVEQEVREPVLVPEDKKV